jgi:hypothetical protein
MHHPYFRYLNKEKGFSLDDVVLLVYGDDHLIGFKKKVNINPYLFKKAYFQCFGANITD